jgi:hypothetical protein
MRTNKINHLFILATLFGLLCFAAYVRRGDYYHKQTDQFYYLSIADSIREHGIVREQVDIEYSLPKTLNMGAAFLMLPLSKLNIDLIFPILSFLYLILHLSTIWPSYKILRLLEVPENTAVQALNVYFASFSATMFVLWPLNEGPSLALLSWFIYLSLLEKNRSLTTVIACIAPIFRFHIFILEMALTLFGILQKRWSLVWSNIYYLIVSTTSMAFYAFVLPNQQEHLGRSMKSSQPFINISRGILMSFLNLFVPEGATEKFLTQGFDLQVLLAAALFLIFTCYSFYAGIKLMGQRKFSQLGLIVFGLSTLTLIFSTVIIARFYILAYFWIIISLIVFLNVFNKKVAKVFSTSMILMNFAALAYFFCTPSSGENFAAGESIKELTQYALDYPIVYYDSDLFTLNRQIYGYMRRPTASFGQLNLKGRFNFLTVNPTLVYQSINGCNVLVGHKHQNGRVTLLNVDCP